ncbi:FAD-binding oxidoreductase [Marinobacter salinisoli]|uniref:FAD-binding oxidoreductase n=1 Tax=Marinobacter salinisoli TaxID=2769486 RepID=A0ABX7MUE8_9GAMM|nr:FAD-dependent oxidoreductase [Marinobacter salinisoli]QSP95009.1 FAD-binding oxidoreductase [Marinobacter salinisoli]
MPDSSALTQAVLWWQGLPEPEPAAPCPELQPVDVAIVGAGFTGLWTAYFLKQLRPAWRIAIFEQHHVGYGASGRNGGWLIGGIAGQEDWLGSLPASEREQSQQLLYGIVERVRAICERHRIDCDFSHAGVLYAAARYPEQIHAARSWLHGIRSSGQPESAFHWLSKPDTESLLNLPDVYGGLYSPHCATINPIKLCLGLAHTLKGMGVQIVERARVDEVTSRRLTINAQPVQCGHIVLASEAFPATWQPLSRKRLPVYSNVIATRALSEHEWQQTVNKPGLAFSDLCRSITYGQRSQGGHMVFGARGGYQFGARARFEFTPDDPAFRAPATFLRRLFPSLTEQDIQYRWAGSLAMSRGFRPFAGFDKDSCIAYAGGYGGEGVGASHLFGQTLAELITESGSIYTQQPWVIRGSPSQLKNWEAEPVPWLGYHMLGKLFALEDWLCHEKKLPWLHKPLNSLSRLAGGLIT